jgi:two-component system response regulator YesN
METIKEKFFYEHSDIVIWETREISTASGKHGASGMGALGVDIPLCIEKLFVAVEIGDRDRVEAITANLFSVLKVKKYCEMKFKGLCFNVLNEVVKKVLEHYPVLKDALSSGEEIMAEVYDTANISELSRYFISKLDSLTEHITSVGSQTVMKKVLHYIDNNYSMDLSLEMLGELFGYNSCYLGKAFKQFSGECFNDYLEKVRIENAKALLLKGYKAGEVAYKTGFKNIDYFYFKFKKNVGVSTSEYKKNILA